MQEGKKYLIEVPEGKQFVAQFTKSEQKFYYLKFEKCDINTYSNKSKKIAISRFETGFACMEGTDYLIIKEIK